MAPGVTLPTTAQGAGVRQDDQTSSPAPTALPTNNSGSQEDTLGGPPARCHASGSPHCKETNIEMEEIHKTESRHKAKDESRHWRPHSTTLPSLLRAAAGPYQALRRLHHIVLHRWWLWEFVSLAVSTMAMMAVVIILYKIDDTALSDWTFPIQPNSLISIFMTVSKSALLIPIAECISQSKWFEFRRGPRSLVKLQDFDEASRGPWGSAQLLFSPRVAGWIAWLGALFTVVSLALDPFTQQVFAYPSRYVPSGTGIAQVRVTQSLKRIDKATMQGAIMSSIYSPKAAKASYLTYNCTTSSCRWDRPVTSLSVCAACRNITSLVTPECTTSPGPLFPTDGERWSFSTTTCNYIINSNVTFSVYIQTLALPAANGRHAEYASQYTQLKVLTPSTRFGLGLLIDDKINWISTIASYATLFDKEQRDMPPLRIYDLQPDLFVCGIYFCAQAYEGLGVSNGSLVNTTPAISRPLYNMPGTDGKPGMVSVDGGLANVLTLSSNALPEAAAAAEAAEAGFVPFPGNTTFLVSQRAMFLLLGTFRETFIAIFNLTQSSGNDAFAAFPEPNSGMDGLLKTAYRNMSDAFAQLAEGITAQIRIADGSLPVPGHALTDETFVRVRWEWMALPLAVLAATAALLAVTICHNRGGTARIWKSSSIALLVHPLQGCDQHEAQLSSLETMEEFARGVKVQLERCGGSGLGYTFVRVPSQEPLVPASQ